ncbi:TlpA family protein disulfide reductase [Dyadobacter sandarakinus]|uniref:TlpA family protein disulfide reductase n=1 Tax=Dyadobacter sandarakinus TaxID=2747268 RepID=A0ABX7I311_9BACT|nr:TlpA disulfide reductase family protein [Dyadobacter sandarakinus]QRR00175.1 TlpA family protein disulfide reductase [Dyadobacter sandarakinus]
MNYRCASLILALFFIGNTVFSQVLNLKGQGIIKIEGIESDTSIPVSVEVLHSFPAYGSFEQQDTISTMHHTVQFTCPVYTIQQVSVTIADKKLSVILEPSDTVFVRMKGSINDVAFEIDGKNKAIQDYYLAKAKQYPVSVGQQVMNAGVGDLSLDAFMHLADSLFMSESAFLNSNSQALPQWFLRYEKDAIRYSDAYLRLYIYQYRKAVKHAAANTPANYFDFLKKLEIRNLSALYNYAYLFFLREYVSYKSAANTQSSAPGKKNNSVYKQNVGLLGQQTGEFFTLFTISESLNDNPRQVEKSLAEIPVPHFYPALVPYLKESASQRIGVLRSGKPSPNFVLTDEQDSLVSLKDFRGQIVYLSFWFAGCKGCIQEFPFEKELVAQFKNEPVKIISICTRTTREKWLEKINQFGLNTINLYANATWGNTLEEQFAIHVYPQYVLIGRDGSVIENFTARPSNGASEKIAKALLNNR